MGPESVNSRDVLRADRTPEPTAIPVNPAAELTPVRPEPNELNWVIFGSQGLRAGWSLLVFGMLLYFLLDFFRVIVSFVVQDVAHMEVDSGTPLNTILGEGIRAAAVIASMLIVAALERRRLAAYNLGGSRRLRFFLGGVAAGFVAISVLVGVLSEAGWLRFGPVALAGPPIFEYALLWGVAFVLVGVFEEGAFRCYLLSTFARGVNFWWALATVAAVCVYLMTNPQAHGAGGIYAVALTGVFPCLYIHLGKMPGSGFWQAAWVTSVGFGFIHTFNHGENWMGVLAAAVIGIVFCVSVRVTGSAWWAIGCHASWDWAESYFYGTADSGFNAHGHLLSTMPSGSTLWSGGAAGPEGSVLVFPIMLLLLVAVVVLYGRRRSTAVDQPAVETAG